MPNTVRALFAKVAAQLRPATGLGLHVDLDDGTGDAIYGLTRTSPERAAVLSEAIRHSPGAMPVKLQAVIRWAYYRLYDGLWDKPGFAAVHLVRKFRKTQGYTPRLISPRTFNEKVLGRILFDRNPIQVTFASKVASRDFVRRRMCSSDTLVPLIAIVDRADEIPSLKLPAQFVMKGSHGSGMVHIQNEKSPTDMANLVRIAQEWLQVDYGKFSGEWFYKKVKKQIVFEELLSDGNDDVPKDYKFFCYHGKVSFVQVDSDRFSRHTRDLFDRNWMPIGGTYEYLNGSVRPAKPEDLRSMIDIAERLSTGIDFVRVDLYSLASCIKFGEMTSTPEAAMGVFTPRELDEAFGRPWN